MNVIISLSKFDYNAVYFGESIKNNVINNGSFIRITYSTNFVTLNGIYLDFPLLVSSVDKYYNKIKCKFNIYNENKDLIQMVGDIERQLLQKINLPKQPTYKLYELLCSGNLKLFLEQDYDNKKTFILKISGIWETDTEYGLTYKFII